MIKIPLGIVVSGLTTTGILIGQPFLLPTPNQAIFEPGREADYFVATPGRNWESGTFGCVRSEGWQLHEGIDIRCVERDNQGEPIDPVFATAAGKVVYCNRHPGLSAFGNYLVLQHQIENLEIYSLYAHLREIRGDLAPGSTVDAGEAIAVMGRTANTGSGISRERAHLHFEINLFINDRFDQWFEESLRGSRNDHGIWNGLNFLGLDPVAILLGGHLEGDDFSLLEYVRNQRELCRVLIGKNDFPWLHRYPYLIKRNPVAEEAGITGYEIAFNFTGVPFLLIPRCDAEMEIPESPRLLEVNKYLYEDHRCCRMIRRRGQWQLSPRGRQLLNKLTYQ